MMRDAGDGDGDAYAMRVPVLSAGVALRNTRQQQGAAAAAAAAAAATAAAATAAAVAAGPTNAAGGERVRGGSRSFSSSSPAVEVGVLACLPLRAGGNHGSQSPPELLLR